MFSFGQSSNFGSHSGSSPQTNAFGQQLAIQQQPNSWLSQPKFGSSVFGSPAATTTMFGNTGLNSNTSVFGSAQTGKLSLFTSSTNQAGTPIPFHPVHGSDTMMKNSVASNISTRIQSITAMKEYEDKSFEELRLEDYQLNRKGKTQTMFGSQMQPQQSTSIFSNTGATTQNVFGQSTNTFGNPSGGSVFSGLNQNQPKPLTNFLSTPQSTPFGGGLFNSFGKAPQTTSIFGSSNNTNSANNSYGATGFNFLQPQQQQQGFGSSLFGQKAITASTTTSSFGTSNIFAKPGGMFGTTNTAQSGFSAPTQFNTGTGGIFGSQQQKSTFGLSNFGAQQSQPQQPANASMFGQTAPTFNFPVTGSAFVASTPFNATGTQNFGCFGPTQNFSVGNQTFNPGFGGSPSASSFASPSTMNFSTNYNQPNTFTQQSQQFVTPPYVPFATTPFKDSPLFYNLITNRNVDELTKPTDPIAQRALKEASKRRQTICFNTTGSSNAKNFISPLPRSKIFTANKKSIFDGFEDDLSVCIDILSPKSDCKKLSMKAVKSLERSRHSLPLFTRVGQSSISSTVDSSFDLNDCSSVENSFDGNHKSQNCGDSVTSSKYEDYNESFQSVGDQGDHCEVQKNGDDSSSLDNSLNVGKTDTSASAAIPHTQRCNLKCTRHGYYMYPKIEDLDLQTDEMGNCFVKGFVVGRHNYGRIEFSEVVNVAGVDIDENVLFRHKEVVVYPDDFVKPPPGEGLNCPAEVIIERVWPIEKETQEPIKSSDKLQELKYETKLRRACNRQNAEFVSYDVESGSWRFKVTHF